MRRVACYSASSKLRIDEQRDVVLDGLAQTVQEWLAAKGPSVAGPDVSKIALQDGRTASFSSQSWSIPDGRVTEYQLTEPADGGQFMTRLLVGGRGQSLAVFVELRAGGESLTLRPLLVDARCPDIYRRLLGSRDWYTGESLVRPVPIPFNGTAGGDAFIQVLRHRDRNLPLIAVSTVESSPLVPQLAEGLARDLAGLAIVAVLDESASWGITNDLGKEWSCYNRAIRLYWPIKGRPANAFSNPLWRADWLVENAGSPRAAAERLRNQLRRQLLALSTYTISEPALLTEVVGRSTEARLDELRRNAEGQGEWQQLAEEYAKENSGLKARNGELEERVAALEDQVANLSVAFRYQSVAEEQQPIPPEDVPSLETLEEAVSEARRRFGETLVFGEDVSEGVGTVAEDAGPPDKVFDYLKTVSDMTRQRRSKGLGKDMIPWLTEQGVRASNESETVANSSAEMQKRTWRDGIGGRRKFVKHLKPKDGTSPDQCVRIYFDYDEGLGKTIVGWVGRHPE